LPNVDFCGIVPDFDRIEVSCTSMAEMPTLI
jgi:hypothetical protein